MVDCGERRHQGRGDVKKEREREWTDGRDRDRGEGGKKKRQTTNGKRGGGTVERGGFQIDETGGGKQRKGERE